MKRRKKNESFKFCNDVYAPLVSNSILTADIEAYLERFMIVGTLSSFVELHDLHKLEFTRYCDEDTKYQPIFTLRLNEEKRLQQIKWYSNDNGISFAALSSLPESSLSLIDMNAQKQVHTFQFDRFINSFDINKSNLIAIASRQKNVLLCDLRTQNSSIILQGHENDLTDVVFLSHDNILLTSSKDKTLRFWDIRKSGKNGLLNTVSYGINGNQPVIKNLKLTRDGTVFCQSADHKLSLMKSSSVLKFSQRNSSKQLVGLQLQLVDLGSPVTTFAANDQFIVAAEKSNETVMSKERIRVFNRKSNELQVLETSHFKPINVVCCLKKTARQFYTLGHDGFLFSYSNF